MDTGTLTYPNQVLFTEDAVPFWHHSLIILAGCSGSGKTTFVQKHFAKTMWISTDECRTMVCDSPTNQRASEDAFDIFYALVEKRLKNGCPTVADSTALKPCYRQRLAAIARKYAFRTVLIFFDLPKDLCIEQDQHRRYSVGEEVLEQQFKATQKTRLELKNEQYDQVLVFHTQEEVNRFSLRWTSSLVEIPEEGPWDIIGDIHGCGDQLMALLAKLGYLADSAHHCYYHPQKRRAIFLGDIMDRGKQNLQVFETVYGMWRFRSAHYLPGNHCNKLFRCLLGRKININEGLDTTLAELQSLSPEQYASFVRRFLQMYAQAPPYLILDHGKLVTSHAGILVKYLGRVDRKVWDCCLYGPGIINYGEGGSNALAWTEHHPGTPMVVHGHIPVATAAWRNNTLDIDLGAGKNGCLAALRYPEKQLISV